MKLIPTTRPGWGRRVFVTEGSRGRRIGTGPSTNGLYRRPNQNHASMDGLERRRTRNFTTARASSSATDDLTFLKQNLETFEELPPSEQDEVTQTSQILNSLKGLQSDGKFKLWGVASESSVRRNVFPGELTRGPNKIACKPEVISQPSVRNDAAFLFSVVMTTSIIATLSGVLLPGDFGFFVPYFVGGISLGVLAIGSTAPGLLTFAIDRFSLVFPDYRERTLKHEAAHFLIAYLHGAPVARYSLEIRRQHVQLAQAVLQRKLYTGPLEDAEVDSLAVIAMAGVAAEAMTYDSVIGQTEDLMDLQRLMDKSKDKLNDAQQQSLTRWALYRGVTLLGEYSDAYERLMRRMQEGKSVYECILAIENLS